jgi:preprotein translocase subunit SecG
MADIFFALVLSLLAIFLILLVLVQRGRGGGLAGALGGMGGSSAFGAKAGDVFTRITIITAAIWICICLIAVFWAKHGGDAFSGDNPNALPVRTEPLNAPSGNAAGDTGATAPTGDPGGGPGTTAPAATEAQSPSDAPAATRDATPPSESAPAGSSDTGGAAPPSENQ